MPVYDQVGFLIGSYGEDKKIVDKIMRGIKELEFHARISKIRKNFDLVCCTFVVFMEKGVFNLNWI